MSRVLQPEVLDTLPVAEALPSLRDLGRINRWLGGNRILAGLLRPYLAEGSGRSVLDVGAADGQSVAWLRQRFPNAQFLCTDRNEGTLRRGAGMRVAADVLAWPFAPKSVDIVICSLFLHHFENYAVQQIVGQFEKTARRAVVIVDLHRHWLARGFLPATRWIAGWHPVTVSDGRISVDAAFTPAELRGLIPQARVRSHWPWFRLSAVIDLARRQ